VAKGAALRVTGHDQLLLEVEPAALTSDHSRSQQRSTIPAE
jgi:hypothetical protein